MSNSISDLGDLEERQYFLEMIPRHLIELGQNNRLHRILTTIDFLSTKIYAVGPQLLLDDYNLALTSNTLTLTKHIRKHLSCLEEAIRLSINALAEDAQQTYTQLYARLHTNADFRESLGAYKPAGPWLRLISDRLGSSGGLVIRTLVGHSSVLGCALSADGNVAMSASEDHTMRVWNLRTGQSHLLRGHDGPVSACALSGNGTLALSASHDHTLRLWSISDNAIYYQHVLSGHADRVAGCALSENGKLALSASHDKTLRAWDTATGKCTCRFEGHTDKITCCALSSSGRLALSGSLDTTLRLWDTSTGECLTIMDDSAAGIISCDLSGDGCLAISACSALLVGDEDRSETPGKWVIPIYAFGPTLDATDDVERTFPSIDLEHSDSVERLDEFLGAIENWERSLAEERIVRVWDTRGAKCIGSIYEPEDVRVLNCVLSKDGEYAISSTDDGLTRLWNVKAGKCLSVFQQSGTHVSACALAKDKSVLLSAPFTGDLRLWNVRKAIEAKEVQDSSASKGGFLRGRYSRDSKEAISFCSNAMIESWDAETGVCRKTIRIAPVDVAAAVDVSVDSRRALLASRDFIIRKSTDPRVVDLDTGETLHVLTGHTAGIRDCAISRNGRIGISASWDNTLRVWDIVNGTVLHVMEEHDEGVALCALSWDGQIAVCVLDDKNVAVWDAIEGKYLRKCEGHTAEIIGCSLSGDGRRILSVSEDCTLRLWDTQNGRCVGRNESR